MRQPQIAETLKLSQARVSRMLKQAESLGIVTTVITMPPGVHGDLEDQLQAHYGLRDVVVVDAEPAEVRAALGAATAAYLGITLTRGHVVGITSWSESVLAAGDAACAGGRATLQAHRRSMSRGRPSATPNSRTSSLNKSRKGSSSFSFMFSGSPPTLWWLLIACALLVFAPALSITSG